MELGGILKAMFNNSMSMIPKGKITVYFPQKNKLYLINFQKLIWVVLFGVKDIFIFMVI